MTELLRQEWPGDPEGELEARLDRERQENEAVLRRRSEQDGGAPQPQPIPEKE